MNATDTKKALLTAQRAYARAMQAKTCGEAANNLRLGQKWEQRAREAIREIIPRKLEYRFYSPVQRELMALDAELPNAGYNAHLHRLDKCGITQMQHEHSAAEERSRAEWAVEKSQARARKRQERKRPKKRGP